MVVATTTLEALYHAYIVIHAQPPPGQFFQDPRLRPGQFSTLDLANDGAAVDELERARNNIDRALFGVAFLEQKLAGRRLTDLHLARQRREIVSLQTVKGR